jgi:PAS domain S-box-containing protein
MSLSLASVHHRHDHEQITALVVGVIVATFGIGFVGKILHDHELLQAELHEVNDVLRERETLLRSTFDNAATGMITMGVDFHLIDVNDSFLQAVGYGRDEIWSAHVSETMHPDELAGSHLRLSAMLAGEISGSQQDLRFKTKTGEWKWFSTSTTLIRNPDNSPAYFLTQALDIGDRVAVETALLEQREMHRRLLAALSEMGECVIVGEGTKIVWANEAYARLAGYTVDEMIGMDSSTLFAHDSEHAAWEIRKTELDSGLDTGSLVEAELRRKDGTSIPIEGSTHRILANGSSQRISVIRDVSDRRRWEQAITERTAELLVANDELREANKLKTDLIGMLSHEIGQPLTTIVGYSEMLADDWDAMDDDMRKNGIARIDGASHHLSRLVDEMLTMIRADAGVLHATVQTVNLRQVVEQSVAIVADVMAEPITIHVPNDLDVLVDANHFQQVLVNLFTNAAKYGHPPFEVTADRNANWVRLEVVDHGEGVPDEFVPHLFSRFSRAANEVTQSAKGTGLGLFIVSNLLGASNATVHYERNEPQGSRFVMDLQPAEVRQFDGAGQKH